MHVEKLLFEEREKENSKIDKFLGNNIFKDYNVMQ